jgi:dihydroorotate dehydrogenase (NAD+) catalytic subunit
MKTKLAGVEFQNPLLLASGTFGFGLEFPDVVRQMGGIVSKGITLKACPGNPAPRIWEVSGGIVNSVGLENPGARAFARDIAPKMLFGKARVLLNVAGFAIDDYAEIIRCADGPTIHGFELNVSCPNVKHGGAAFGQDPRLVARITTRARRVTRKLLIVKLTANFIDPRTTARAAAEAGADAVSLINTVSALVLNREGKPALGGVTGGLSGPAIKPFALYCVRQVAQTVTIPVIGGGGITSAADVREFLACGATLVQIGSVNLLSPTAGLDILKTLRRSKP